MYMLSLCRHIICIQISLKVAPVLSEAASLVVPEAKHCHSRCESQVLLIMRLRRLVFQSSQLEELNIKKQTASRKLPYVRIYMCTHKLSYCHKWPLFFF